MCYKGGCPNSSQKIPHSVRFLLQQACSIFLRCLLRANWGHFIFQYIAPVTQVNDNVFSPLSTMFNHILKGFKGSCFLFEPRVPEKYVVYFANLDPAFHTRSIRV